MAIATNLIAILCYELTTTDDDDCCWPYGICIGAGLYPLAPTCGGYCDISAGTGVYPGGVVFCSSAMIVTVRGAIQPGTGTNKIGELYFCRVCVTKDIC